MYTIFSKPGCTQCTEAKALLKKRGISFFEIELDVGQASTAKLYPLPEFKAKYPDVKAVPFILEGERVVGGLANLRAELL